jgi:hypothetical protein
MEEFIPIKEEIDLTNMTEKVKLSNNISKEVQEQLKELGFKEELKQFKEEQSNEKLRFIKQLTDFKDQQLRERQDFFNLLKDFETDIKKKMTQMFEDTEFMTGLKTIMLNAITQEVKSRFADEKLRETVTEISIDQIKTNMSYFIGTVVEQVVEKFVDRLKVQQYISKCLAYSYDSDIKHVLRDMGGNKDYEDRVMKVIQEAIKEATTKVCEQLGHDRPNLLENKTEEE